MKKALNSRFIFLIWLTFAVSACTMGGVAPKSIKQQLFTVDGNLTAVIKTVTDLRIAGAIDDKAYLKIDPVIQNANTTMMSAWIALNAGNVETAQGKAEIVNKLILQLRAYAQEHAHE